MSTQSSAPNKRSVDGAWQSLNEWSGHGVFLLRARHGDAIRQGKWIGDKITSVRQPDGSVKNTQYIDLDPFDADGKPKNNWVKVFEYVDSGSTVVSWSGRVSTWRIDEANNVYGKFMSVRSVLPQ